MANSMHSMTIGGAELLPFFRVVIAHLPPDVVAALDRLPPETAVNIAWACFESTLVEMTSRVLKAHGHPGDVSALATRLR